MTASLMPNGKQQFFNSSGSPLAGGKVYTYAAGTTTNKATYTTPAAAVQNANPVVLDARGEATIFWSGSYNVVVKDASDNLIYSTDNYAPVADSLSASTGAGLVGFQQAGAGSVPRTVQAKERDIVSLADYMTAAQLADVQARTLTLDVSAAINAAVLANPNGLIWAPSGTYKKTSGTTLAASQQIKGAGPANTIFSCSDAFDAFTLSSDYAGISDCGFTSAAARTANAYVKLSAATRGNFVRRVKMTNAFIGAWVAAEAVITYFEDIELQNTAPTVGVGIWINGGNDTFLSRVVMDSPVGSQPLCGVRISRSQATWATDCDMIHQGVGIQIDPDGASSGLITWCFFQDVACDLGSGDGLYINANNATVKGLFFDNCWFSSNLNGINITKTGTGAVDGVFFDGCTIFNNNNRGAWTQIASNVELNNCKVSGNSQASSGTYAGIEFANSVVSFAVRNTRSGAIAGFANTQKYGLLIGATCNQYVVTDNNFIGNVTASALDNSQTTSGTREVRGNLGFKTIAHGASSVLTGATEVVITHGLAGTPTMVLCTPSNIDVGAVRYWTGTFGATTFKINTSAAVGADSPFSWTASLYN